MGATTQLTLAIWGLSGFLAAACLGMSDTGEAQPTFSTWLRLSPR